MMIQVLLSPGPCVSDIGSGSVSLQRTEDQALDHWLMGTRPASGALIGYQSSKHPQDWLMTGKESKVSPKTRTRTR